MTVRHVCIIATACALLATPAAAQQPDDSIGIRGFASFGNITFQAQDSFDAVLDTHSGLVLGGGAQVLLPWGIYAEVGASRFSATGERVFIGPNREVFRLGIPLEVNITPLEITGGWRFRKWSRVVPYGGVGYSSYRYEEMSEFSAPGENVNERFGGFHVVGGAEFQPLRWLAVGGEVAWSTIPDAIGEGGVSAAFDEDNLGGTSVRVKISVGR